MTTMPVIEEAQDATPLSVLTPVPGESLDPAPKKKPASVAKLENKTPWATAGWQALQRFKAAKAPLIAGGTAYYAFLAMFSLLALAYGLATIVSADSIATSLTDALEEALPGLVGDGGIDPEALKRVGRATSIVGLLLLGYSGSAVMVAASDSLHHIYGAAADGRNVIRRRVYLIGWLAVIGPLIALSYAMTTVVSGFGGSLLDDLGVDSGIARALLVVAATLVTFALDVGIMFLLLGRLGGIKPSRRSVLVGALVGAVIVGVFKAVMARIISWSVDKPEYGSFAVPISILVVLWFQSLGLYVAAAITAGVATTRAVYGADDVAVEENSA